jgi:hypothetical protein
MPLFDDIGMEAGALVHTEDSGYAADDATDCATYNCPDRTCRSFTVSRTLLDASGDTLCKGRNGNE